MHTPLMCALQLMRCINQKVDSNYRFHSRKTRINAVSSKMCMFSMNQISSNCILQSRTEHGAILRLLGPNKLLVPIAILYNSLKYFFNKQSISFQISSKTTWISGICSFIQRTIVTPKLLQCIIIWDNSFVQVKNSFLSYECKYLL